MLYLQHLLFEPGMSSSIGKALGSLVILELVTLAFGQLPIRLCYVNVVKPREIITSGLEWIRIAPLPPDADTIDIDLSAWVPALFIT